MITRWFWALLRLRNFQESSQGPGDNENTILKSKVFNASNMKKVWGQSWISVSHSCVCVFVCKLWFPYKYLYSALDTSSLALLSWRQLGKGRNSNFIFLSFVLCCAIVIAEKRGERISLLNEFSSYFPIHSHELSLCRCGLVAPSNASDVH